MDMRLISIGFDTGFLREATALVDDRLDKLDREAKTHPDPDSYGLYDSAEYITGFGFVACQTYLTAVSRWSDLNKGEALKLGPKHRSGRPMIELVNACANYWKHNPEWSLDSPSTQAQRTIDIVASLGVDTSVAYPLAGALYQILDPHAARFRNLIPFLTQWRDEILGR